MIDQSGYDFQEVLPPGIEKVSNQQYGILELKLGDIQLNSDIEIDEFQQIKVITKFYGQQGVGYQLIPKNFGFGENLSQAMFSILIPYQSIISYLCDMKKLKLLVLDESGMIGLTNIPLEMFTYKQKNQRYFQNFYEFFPINAQCENENELPKIIGQLQIGLSLLNFEDGSQQNLAQNIIPEQLTTENQQNSSNNPQDLSQNQENSQKNQENSLNTHQNSLKTNEISSIEINNSILCIENFQSQQENIQYQNCDLSHENLEKTQIKLIQDDNSSEKLKNNKENRQPINIFQQETKRNQQNDDSLELEFNLPMLQNKNKQKLLNTQNQDQSIHKIPNEQKNHQNSQSQNRQNQDSAQTCSLDFESTPKSNSFSNQTSKNNNFQSNIQKFNIQDLVKSTQLKINLFEFHQMSTSFSNICYRNLFIDLQFEQHESFEFTKTDDQINIFCHDQRDTDFIFQEEVYNEISLDKQIIQKIASEDQKSIKFYLKSFNFQADNENFSGSKAYCDLGQGQLSLNQIFLQKINRSQQYYIDIKSVDKNEVLGSLRVQFMIEAQNEYSKSRESIQLANQEIPIQKQQYQTPQTPQPQPNYQKQPPRPQTQMPNTIFNQSPRQSLNTRPNSSSNTPQKSHRSFQVLFRLGKLKTFTSDMYISYNFYARYKIYGTQEVIETEIKWNESEPDLDHKLTFPVNLQQIQKMINGPFIIELWNKSYNNTKLHGLIKLNLQNIPNLTLNNDKSDFNLNFLPDQSSQLLILYNEMKQIYNISGKQELGQIFVQFAFGTSSQIYKLDNNFQKQQSSGIQSEQYSKTQNFQPKLPQNIQKETKNEQKQIQKQKITENQENNKNFQNVQQVDIDQSQVVQHEEKARTTIIDKYIHILHVMSKNQENIKKKWKNFQIQQQKKNSKGQDMIAGELIKFLVDDLSIGLEKNDVEPTIYFLNQEKDQFQNSEMQDFTLSYNNFVLYRDTIKQETNQIISTIHSKIIQDQSISIQNLEKTLMRLSEFGIIKNSILRQYFVEKKIFVAEDPINFLIEILDEQQEGVIMIEQLIDLLNIFQKKGKINEILINQYVLNTVIRQNIVNQLQENNIVLEISQDKYEPLELKQIFMKHQGKIDKVSVFECMILLQSQQSLKEQFLIVRGTNDNKLQQKQQSDNQSNQPQNKSQFIQETPHKIQSYDPQNSQIQQSEQQKITFSQFQSAKNDKNNEIDDLNDILNNQEDEKSEEQEECQAKISIFVKDIKNLLLGDLFDSNQMSISFEFQEKNNLTKYFIYDQEQDQYQIQYSSVNIVDIIQEDIPNQKITFKLQKKNGVNIASNDLNLKPYFNLKTTQNFDQTIIVPLMINDFYTSEFENPQVGLMNIQIKCEYKNNIEQKSLVKQSFCENENQLEFEEQNHSILLQKLPKVCYFNMQIVVHYDLQRILNFENQYITFIEVVFHTQNTTKESQQPFKNIKSTQLQNIENGKLQINENLKIEMDEQMIQLFQNSSLKIKLFLQKNSQPEIFETEIQLLDLLDKQSIIAQEKLFSSQQQFVGIVKADLSYSEQQKVFSPIKQVQNCYSQLLLLKITELLVDFRQNSEQPYYLKFEILNKNFEILNHEVYIDKSRNLPNLTIKYELNLMEMDKNIILMEIIVYKRNTYDQQFTNLGQINLNIQDLQQFNKHSQFVSSYICLQQKKIRLKMRASVFSYKKYSQFPIFINSLCKMDLNSLIKEVDDKFLYLEDIRNYQQIEKSQFQQYKTSSQLTELFINENIFDPDDLIPQEFLKKFEKECSFQDFNGCGLLSYQQLQKSLSYIYNIDPKYNVDYFFELQAKYNSKQVQNRFNKASFSHDYDIFDYFTFVNLQNGAQQKQSPIKNQNSITNQSLDQIHNQSEFTLQNQQIHSQKEAEFYQVNIQIIQGIDLQYLMTGISPNIFITCDCFGIKTQTFSRESNPQINFQFQKSKIAKKDLPKEIVFKVFHEKFNSDVNQELFTSQFLGSYTHKTDDFLQKTYFGSAIIQPHSQIKGSKQSFLELMLKISEDQDDLAPIESDIINDTAFNDDFIDNFHKTLQEVNKDNNQQENLFCHDFDNNYENDKNSGNIQSLNFFKKLSEIDVANFESSQLQEKLKQIDDKHDHLFYEPDSKNKTETYNRKLFEDSSDSESPEKQFNNRQIIPNSKIMEFSGKQNFQNNQNLMKNENFSMKSLPNKAEKDIKSRASTVKNLNEEDFQSYRSKQIQNSPNISKIASIMNQKNSNKKLFEKFQNISDSDSDF